MYKFLFFVSIILIGATQAQAQMLSGCAMANGSLAHKVSQIDDQLVGRFDFPTFRDLREDPTGQTHSVNSPLSNDGVFSDRLNFLEEKHLFLKDIFGDDRSLTVNFDFCELQQSNDHQFSARFCFKNGPFVINGIELKRLEFSIQNQVRTSLVGSQGQVGLTNVVYADLLFTTTADVNGIIRAYRSSFTYYPNGDSIQCSLN